MRNVLLEFQNDIDLQADEEILFDTQINQSYKDITIINDEDNFDKESRLLYRRKKRDKRRIK